LEKKHLTDETGHTAPDEVRSQEQKKDAGKVRMELIDPYAMEQLAAVLTFGATKYEANGWRKGIAWMRTCGALLRHTFKFIRGETYDEETGLHHMAHVMCNAMFLVNWSVTHPELDDRYRPAPITWVGEENGAG
jgi:hypothetical protein